MPCRWRKGIIKQSPESHRLPRLHHLYYNNDILFFQIFQFPSQCTGTQYSSIRILQFGNEQFRLTFIDIQDIIINGLLNRFHDIVTGLSQATEQYNGFRAGKCDGVCQSFTQNVTCKAKDFLCQFITLYSCIIYIF